MKKLTIIFLSLGLVYVLPIFAANSISIKVINNIPKNSHCIYESNTVSLFVPPNNQQIPMMPRSSKTISVPKTFVKYMFGVQDNGWYWRTPPATGQNPDNAGMQVIVTKNCNVTTSASWAGPGTPDARKLITVSASKVASSCIVTLNKKSGGLCVTKQCCGPGSGAGSCKALGYHYNQTSC